MQSVRASLPEPTSEQREVSLALQSLVAREIEWLGGWMPFDRYMQLVLYAPGLGYYAAGARKFGDSGVGGDFVTAPEISPLFAQALAAQMAQLFRHTAPYIVEFGAGSGRLAHDLLAALAQRGVRCDGYSIVEVSADLRERQQAQLAGRPVQWLDAAPQSFDGVMLANEVLDVMPTRLFVKRSSAPGGCTERGVVLRDGKLAFAENEAPPDLVAAVRDIEAEVGPLPEGYASEIGFAARAWMHSAAEWLAHGALLAIDYGFPRREYYHPQRLMGTIMCHYRHHAHADPFWLPGLNDLTAHVDFSAMAAAAHDGGLDVLGYTTQAHFLINCGLLEQLQAAPGAASNAAAQRLLSEAEMGELFKVLAVGRGVDAPLLGFARGDRRARL